MGTAGISAGGGGSSTSVGTVISIAVNARINFIGDVGAVRAMGSTDSFMPGAVVRIRVHARIKLVRSLGAVRAVSGIGSASSSRVAMARLDRARTVGASVSDLFTVWAPGYRGVRTGVVVTVAVDTGIELIGELGVMRTMVGGSGISSGLVGAEVCTRGIGGVGGIVVMASNGVLDLVHQSRHYDRLFVSGYIGKRR